MGLAVPPRIRFLQKINKVIENRRAKKLHHQDHIVAGNDSYEKDTTVSKILQKQNEDNDNTSDSDDEDVSVDRIGNYESHENPEKKYYDRDSRNAKQTFFGNGYYTLYLRFISLKIASFLFFYITVTRISSRGIIFLTNLRIALPFGI